MKVNGAGVPGRPGPGDGQPDVSIVIVNWNAKEYLEGCLQSLHYNSHNGLKHEVLVVDNASADGSAAMVAQRFPEAKIILNGINSGFAKANNQGIKESRGRHILLLNPDTVVFPGALGEMVHFLDENPDVGAVGPLMFGARGETLESYSYFPGLRLLLRGLAIVIAGSYYWDEEVKSLEARQVDWVGGACLMVKREALDEIGLLDEAFFMYWEEADLCLRLRKKNWKTYFLPGPRVIHYQGRSAAKAEEKVMIHGILLQEWGRSTEWFFKKHYPLWMRLVFRTALLSIAAVSLIAWAFIYLVFPARRPKAREIIRAYALGLGLIRRQP
ncbi:MAG: glycosyltransferase family 2 protein [Chloroflexi bacterium]|nr:glycosyltransferase family 2 protein [Chloroflexota bacterium]MDA8189333.1 glycosyltransferase family 2 protein [Dehalococcoidales bacterium]